MTQGSDGGDLEAPRLEFVRAAHGEPVLAPAAVGGAGSQRGYGCGSNVLGETEVHLIDYVKVLYSADGRRSRHSSSWPRA